MPFLHWVTVAALATLPLAAAVQAADRQPDPADPDAPVPAFTYRSAIKEYRAAADDEMSPDKAWRVANDEMQGLGGHAGHIRQPGDVQTSPSGSAPAHHGMNHRHKGK